MLSFPLFILSFLVWNSNFSKTNPGLNMPSMETKISYEGRAAGGMAAFLRDVLDLRICFCGQLDRGGPALGTADGKSHDGNSHGSI